MKRHRRLLFVLILLLAMALPMVNAANSSYTGVAYEKKADGTTGSRLVGVQITFIRTDNYRSYTTVTDIRGRYTINLDSGQYWTRACHPNYEDYSSIPKTMVVDPFHPTGDFFLKKPRVTTIILVRHAEKDTSSSDPSNPPLTEEGEARAQILADTAWKAGITDIYTTDTIRTRATVAHLAQKLQLEPITYGYYELQELANTIIANHNGDTVLIAGHSDTVFSIAHEFGAGISGPSIDDFDNLYVITRKTTSNGSIATNFVNLQYGGPSDPDISKGAYPMRTVFLLRHAETATGLTSDPGLNPSGLSRATELVHVLKKAGIKAIYKTSSKRTAQTVKPLADALKLAPINYDPTNIQSISNQPNLSAPKVVLIAADSSAAISQIIKKLHGSPLPPVDPDEYDMLYVITLYTTGDAKVVCLQYGAPSP